MILGRWAVRIERTMFREHDCSRLTLVESTRAITAYQICNLKIGIGKHDPSNFTASNSAF
jgi:hypothetical protein